MKHPGRDKDMKKILQKILYLLIGLGSGVLAGMFIFSSADGISGLKGRGPGAILLEMAVIFAVVVAAVYLQIIFHEGGHLVFGLLSGYKFTSFRIGGLMLKRRESGEGLEFKRFSLAGTGGQCLMCPPPLENGRIPYVLYNLGGSIMNIVTAGLFYLLFLLSPRGSILGFLAVSVAAFGLVYAVVNGVPINTELISNDGYNAMSLGKDPAALRAFWVQLTMNDRQMRGMRLKDMPAEWFEVPEGSDLTNPLIASLLFFSENRAVDSLELEKAEAVCSRILDDAGVRVPGIYRSLMLIEKAFFLLVRGEKEEGLRILGDKSLKAFMKQMKNYPSVLRTQYTAQLAEGRKAEAEKTLAKIEKLYSSYPNPAEIDAEFELLDVARRNLEAPAPAPADSPQF